MNKILIIKLGAFGDVIRTTPILHALKGDIYWVTEKNAMPLLPKNKITEIFDIEDDFPENMDFDLVLSLDDEQKTAELASSVRHKQLVGSYIKNSKITYTELSACWFDMGLISRYGKKKADELKLNNTKTYQKYLFEMAGFDFKGEEYLINNEKIMLRF